MYVAPSSALLGAGAFVLQLLVRPTSSLFSTCGMLRRTFLSEPHDTRRMNVKLLLLSLCGTFPFLSTDMCPFLSLPLWGAVFTPLFFSPPLVFSGAFCFALLFLVANFNDRYVICDFVMAYVRHGRRRC